MTDIPQEERRNSFRIDVNALVKWAIPKPKLATADAYFHELQTFALQSEMDALTRQIDQLSERIKDIAALKSAQLLQQQIKILAKMGAIQQTRLSGLDVQSINISEGGCSLTIEQSFSIDEQIALALVFPPGYFSLFTFVRVRNCFPADGQFRVHLEFIELSEKQRQELVRFMFQAQTLEKKAGNLS